MSKNYESFDGRNQKRGGEIVAFRTKHRMSQRMFAEWIGVNLVTVQKWESNERGFSEPLWRMLQFFDRRSDLIKEL